MTNKERAELAGLPARIEKLEAEQAALAEQLADPAFYAGRAAEAPAWRAQLAGIERDATAAMARWEELEALAAAGGGG